MALLCVALVGGACGAPTPAAAPTVRVAEHPTLGRILVAANGMTLYVFAADARGQSSCYDLCAQNWPPLIVAGGPAAGPGLKHPSKVGTVVRRDGRTQVAYDGRSLYLYIEDSAPGDAVGHEVDLDGGLWFAVRDP